MRVILCVGAALVALTFACGDQEAPPRPLSTNNLIIALDDEHEGTTDALLTLIDLSSGKTVATLRSGYQTWALFRPSAGELLVSDLGGPDSQGRLRVYDIADLSSPKWTLPLQDRAAFIGYGPAMVLSGDERVLYYLVHTRDGEGQSEGQARRIGIVGLDERREIASAELPGSCAALMPLGEADVLALCPNRRGLVSITPDGSVSKVAGPLPASTRAKDPRGFWRSPVYGDVYGDGGAFIAFGNGDVVFSDSRRPVVNLLPPGDVRLWGSGVWSSGEWHLDNHRALFAIGPTEPETQTGILFDSLIVFDPDDPLDPRRFDLPQGITHATPLDTDRVALLDSADATLYMFDLASGEVTGELQVPPGTRWLVGP